MNYYIGKFFFVFIEFSQYFISLVFFIWFYWMFSVGLKAVYTWKQSCVIFKKLQLNTSLKNFFMMFFGGFEGKVDTTWLIYMVWINLGPTHTFKNVNILNWS